MAHFYGIVRGQAKTEGTRRGSKKNGLSTVAASWQGALSVSLSHDEKTGKDMVEVSLIPWHGHGTSRHVFRGAVDGSASIAPSQMVAGKGR